MSEKETIGDICVKKYPNRIPVVVHYENIPLIGTNLINSQKQFLVQQETTIANFNVIIRRNTRISYVEILNLSINEKILDNNETIYQLYTKYKNALDGCLHIVVSKNSTFDSNKNFF